MPTRTLAVGDIHGCFAQLDALLVAVAPEPDDHLVFLGDYVDRGPDSARVLDRLIQLSRTPRATFIKGNHEQMMLAARGGLGYQRDWILNGGDATLMSYAGNRATLRDVRAEHWRFLETRLVDYVETETHIFVHASSYPDHAMADQPDHMLRWERCDRIAPHGSGKVIVCGHTPQRSGRPLNRGYAICIDTGAGQGGLLTCLDSASGRLWQADGAGRVLRSHIADFDGI